MRKSKTAPKEADAASNPPEPLSVRLTVRLPENGWTVTNGNAIGEGVGEAGGYIVATVGHPGRSMREVMASVERDAHNLRLLAAAPAMVEALHRIAADGSVPFETRALAAVVLEQAGLAEVSP